MAKQIVWNKTAVQRLKEIVQYLEAEFSFQSAANLTDRVFEKLETLSRYPEIGRKSKKKKTVRFVNIDKHRQLYYRIHGRQLIVVYFFDTRQHPDKNPY